VNYWEYTELGHHRIAQVGSSGLAAGNGSVAEKARHWRQPEKLNQKHSERSRQVVGNKRGLFLKAVRLLKTGRLHDLSRQVVENNVVDSISRN
jgi:hypothetical protein